MKDETKAKIKSVAGAYWEGFAHPIKTVLDDEVCDFDTEEHVAQLAGYYTRCVSYGLLIGAARAGVSWKKAWDRGEVALLDRKVGKWHTRTFVLKPGGVRFKSKR